MYMYICSCQDLFACFSTPLLSPPPSLYRYMCGG